MPGSAISGLPVRGSTFVRRFPIGAEYLGDGEGFDKGITDFSERYADQNEEDYAAFVCEYKSLRVAEAA